MIFTDPAFLFLYLPVFCLIFYSCGRWLGPKSAVCVLFVASIICYIPWGISVTILLLFSIFVNFLLGVLLANDNSSLNDQKKKILYASGQLFNFVILIWFKYHFIQLLFSIVDHKPLDFATVMIPAGISFYTFHQAAFLADAHNHDRDVVALANNVQSLSSGFAAFMRYGAFVAFFPQLIIGPITYMREFYPQVDRRDFGKVRGIDLGVGFTLIAFGLFKKLVLADNLADVSVFAFQGSQSAQPISTATAVAGILGYYAQLYFDFSGYSDMALGLARICGLRYPINFFSPLKAVGIIDFYRRWHMTLTRVISRFVFTPLSISGTRKGMRLPKRWRPILGLWIPLLINFELIALWHGAATTFIVFGIIHGVWYVVETEIRSSKWFKSWRKGSSDSLRALLGRLIFAGPMMFTFALFRSDSLAGFGRLARAAVGLGKGPWNDNTISPEGLALLGAAFFVIGVLPNGIELLRNYRPGIMTYVNPQSRIASMLPAWRPTWLWAIGLGALVLWSLYFISRQPPFLYQGF
ncbi:MAG: putative rane protein involved in D-alanine export [Bradyrhizobium sp.]|nr:putative rane protein involved in D-alanine export [Bradyrhizobium sp.]